VTGKTHLLGGLAAGTIVAMIAPAQPITILTVRLPVAVTLIAVIAFAGIAALAPDRIQYSIKSARFPLEGHRGVSHTLLFAVVTTFLFRPELRAAWCAGLLSHLLLDVITVAGIPLFWPLRRRRVSLSLTTNGSAGEAVLRALLVMLVVMLWLRPVFKF
jgi:inner membrane protein